MCKYNLENQSWATVVEGRGRDDLSLPQGVLVEGHLFSKLVLTGRHTGGAMVPMALALDLKNRRTSRGIWGLSLLPAFGVVVVVVQNCRIPVLPHALGTTCRSI